jgi:hypothetical protein
MRFYGRVATPAECFTAVARRLIVIVAPTSEMLQGIFSPLISETNSPAGTAWIAQIARRPG